MLLIILTRRGLLADKIFFAGSNLRIYLQTNYVRQICRPVTTEETKAKYLHLRL